MSLEIKPVTDRASGEAWLRLPERLYAGVANFVPSLLSDERRFFDPARNPSFASAEVERFIACSAGQVVGRVCVLINALETEKLGARRGRFGWFESEPDAAVASALLATARHWFEQRGCTEMTGPHGFTDLDQEGLLIEGFDALPTVSGSFNPPIYSQLLESFGLQKDVDYVEFRAAVPDRLPLFEHLRKRLSKQQEYRVHTCRTRRELRARIPAIWSLLEESFAPLYGVVPLTPAQRDFYTRAYFNFLDPDFVKLLFDRRDTLVGFLLAMPSLSRALQRGGGRLLPLGAWHLWRALRRPDTVDFLLAGSKSGEPSGVLTPLGLIDMFDTLRARGVRYIETNHELEDNTSVNRIWSKLEIVNSRRSRVYRMPLLEPR